MCFSAGASFAAGGVLTVAGVASMRRRPSKRERLFAAIPFLFAIQQTIEGVQWLLLKNGTASMLLGYGFLFFAFLLWPTYLPLAAYAMERDKRRQRVLLLFVGAGIMASLFLLLVLLSQSFGISIVQRSVQYGIVAPFVDVGVFVYVFIVCGSMLIASSRYLQLFGALIAGAFAVSYLFFEYAFTSVWCFFAAALSVVVYAYFRSPRRRTS